MHVHDSREHKSRTGPEWTVLSRVSSHPGHELGLVCARAGLDRPQAPHHQDELYYVLRGRGRFRAGGEDTEITAGSLLFVAAEVQHKFYDITEELSVLVFFAPAES